MSTPHSDYIPSTNPYSTSAKIEVMDPSNEKGVTHSVTLAVNDMFYTSFKGDPNDFELDVDILKQDRLDPRTRELLTEYTDYINNANLSEKSSYQLANHILHEITNGEPFWYFKGHNDYRRVPDVACVSHGQRRKFKNGPPHTFERHDKSDHIGDVSLDPPQPVPELSVPSAPFFISHSTSEWAGSWIQGHDRKAGFQKRTSPAQHQSENNKRSKLKSRKAASGRDFVEQNCRYAVELMSMVETGTHDISTLVSGFHSWMYYYLNTVGVEDRRFWNKGARCDIEAAGRIFDLSASLYWKLSRGTRVYRAQEGGVARDFAIKYARSARKRRLEAIGLFVRELTEDANLRAQHDVGDSNTYRVSSVLLSEDNQELHYSFRELVPNSEHDNTGFMRAFVDIFQVLHFSWEKKIAHRDISFGNLMFCRGADGEFVCSAVNDLNLAKVDEFLSEFLFRTGTRVFLARDLLKSVSTLHLERFDWESALYVLIWITTRYENGEEKYTDVLTEWFDRKDTHASSGKNSYIDYFEERPKLKTFKLLNLHWIHPWTVLYRNGFQARSNNARARRWELTSASDGFDDETLGGHVTYEKIWDILEQDFAEDDFYQ